MQGVAQSAPVFRPSNNPDLSGLSRATEEQIGAIGLESRNIYSGRHVELLQNLSRFRIDPTQVALVALPGGVPQLTVNPGDTSDEAVGLDRAKYLSRCG